jgi:hypothetical protein
MKKEYSISNINLCFKKEPERLFFKYIRLRKNVYRGLTPVYVWVM